MSTMTNIEAAQHLREALDGQFRGAFGAWREAMEKAITALEHQPEPRNGNANIAPDPLHLADPGVPYASALQCIRCGAIIDIQKAICTCGSVELHVIRFTIGADMPKGKMGGNGCDGRVRGD